MGTSQRKDREKEARREQILQAAAKLFSEKGFEAATMAQIARQAELAPGTLYLYFKSKDELYFALLEPQLQAHLQCSRRIADDDPNRPADEAIKLLLNESARYYLENPGMIYLLTSYHAQKYRKLFTAERFDQLRSVMRANADVLVELLERGVRQGIFEPMDSWATSILIWNMSMGMIQGQEARVFSGKQHRGYEAVARALDLLINGLTRRTPPDK